MSDFFKRLWQGGKKQLDYSDNDTFKRYENGLRRLLERMGKTHPRRVEALTLEARLKENISGELLHGSSDTRSAERSEIIYALNKLAVEATSTSFNELAGLSITYNDMEQAPDKLRRYLLYRQFEFITQQQAEGFVGREFLFKEVNECLRNYTFKSGYIIIEGEPGIGKTAFIAAMVRRYRCVHHYVNAQEGIIDAKQFLESVCAQLILRYGLPTNLLEDAESEPDNLFKVLLSRAVSVADEKQVVILIDALDEASDKDLPNKYANCLLLPRYLPDGAFIVATTRPPRDTTSLPATSPERLGHSNLVVNNSRIIPLRGSDEQNLLDIREYVKQFIEKHPSIMRQRMAEWNASDSQFTDELVKKSEGNFMYIVSMLRDIFEGRITKDTIDDISFLPDGLNRYYQFHWQRMRDMAPEEFERMYKPVACFLAAAQGPVSIQDIASWSDIEPEQVLRVLNDWKQFFKMPDPGNRRRHYQLYHTSFRDFLYEVEGLKYYHERIAEEIFRKMGGNPDAFKWEP